jgi:drug/metabolite transporter (DMT)-like permease
MKRFGWQVLLGLSLVVLSIVFYLLHYVIFRDPHHIFIYLIGDIAFVFIEVLMVTLIIHRLLSEREKRSRLEKLTMVIGAFFSEVGTRLLVFFSDFDPTLETIRKQLLVTNNWSEKEFSKIIKRLKN